MNVPTHLAIIMDGNGRWAKQRGLARTEGHKEGLKTAQKIVDCALEKGIKFLSLFVFSTENWKRPKTEIALLFSLAEKYLNNFEEFCKGKARVVVSGEREKLPQNLVKKIEEMEQKTAQYNAICVNLCINYGGRQDVVCAARKLAEQGKEITEQSITQNLSNGFIPFPDLVVRTGGQKRLSNFLLFQSAYAELYFCDTLWPDFDEKCFEAVLQDYSMRTRNFGGIKN